MHRTLVTPNSLNSSKNLLKMGCKVSCCRVLWREDIQIDHPLGDVPIVYDVENEGLLNDTDEGSQWDPEQDMDQILSVMAATGETLDSGDPIESPLQNSINDSVFTILCCPPREGMAQGNKGGTPRGSGGGPSIQSR